MKGISHFAPHARALALKNKDFSRDPSIVKTMNEDPLIAHETQPFATMAAIVRANQRLRAAFPQIRLPVLILHGTADKAAKSSGSRLFTSARARKIGRSDCMRAVTTIRSTISARKRWLPTSWRGSKRTCRPLRSGQRRIRTHRLSIEGHHHEPFQW